MTNESFLKIKKKKLFESKPLPFTLSTRITFNRQKRRILSDFIRVFNGILVSVKVLLLLLEVHNCEKFIQNDVKEHFQNKENDSQLLYLIENYYPQKKKKSMIHAIMDERFVPPIFKFVQHPTFSVV